jgi:heterotetrameric sarcosine oxidase gamma subunit
LWLGPDEWLLVDEAGGEAAMVRRLRQALLRVSGPHAEEILAKAATLDFHVRGFPVGSCAQTNIARTQGIIHRTRRDEFRIFVRASFARYLAAWLGDANGIK